MIGVHTETSVIQYVRHQNKWGQVYFGQVCTAADDTKVSGSFDTPKGRDAIQGGGMTGLRIHKLLKAKQGQVQGPTPGSGDPHYQHKLGHECFESNAAEERLGILVDDNLAMDWQCASATQKASCVLSCMKRSGTPGWGK